MFLELVQCKVSITKKVGADFIEAYPNELLFKEGYFYPIYPTEDGQWITLDEEGEQHIISGERNPKHDFWFMTHFELK